MSSIAPHQQYSVKLTTLSEESAFTNALHVLGEGSLSEAVGSTLSFDFSAGEAGQFDLVSAGDPDPDAPDQYRLGIDYNGNGVWDSGENLSQGDLDQLNYQDFLAATQNGTYNAFLGLEDWTDCDFDDQVVKVELDPVACSEPPPPEPPLPVPGLTIIGTASAESLVGAAGNDRIFAAAGSDGLSGGAGNDRLTGGAGHDRMWGGAGADTFIFRPDDGRDRILDFGNGNDRINVRKLDIEFADVNQAQVGTDLVLTFDGHTNRIVLDDVASVNANDFLF